MCSETRAPGCVSVRSQTLKEPCCVRTVLTRLNVAKLAYSSLWFVSFRKNQLHRGPPRRGCLFYCLFSGCSSYGKNDAFFAFAAASNLRMRLNLTLLSLRAIIVFSFASRSVHLRKPHSGAALSVVHAGNKSSRPLGMLRANTVSLAAADGLLALPGALLQRAF